MEVKEILNRLFGKIEPYGDTTIDEEREANLEFYYEATSYFINELIESAKRKNDNRYSVNKIGNKCYEFLKEVQHQINYEISYIEEE